MLLFVLWVSLLKVLWHESGQTAERRRACGCKIELWFWSLFLLQYTNKKYNFSSEWKQSTFLTLEESSQVVGNDQLLKKHLKLYCKYTEPIKFSHIV